MSFFFRESDLTWPDFRIRGNSGRIIRKLLTDHEPEWDQVLMGMGALGHGFAIFGHTRLVHDYAQADGAGFEKIPQMWQHFGIAHPSNRGPLSAHHWQATLGFIDQR